MESPPPDSNVVHPEVNTEDTVYDVEKAPFFEAIGEEESESHNPSGGTIPPGTAITVHDETGAETTPDIPRSPEN